MRSEVEILTTKLLAELEYWKGRCKVVENRNDQLENEILRLKIYQKLGERFYDRE